jgi:microcystin-dependent protein
MPKLKGPLFSLDAWGAFAKKIIYTRGNQARIYFKPRNPNSAAQQAQRDYFKENFVSNKQAFPVGAGFISFVDTNPAALLGYGVWELVGPGRMMVGYDPEQVEFDEIGKEGGEKEHTITIAESAAHAHSRTAHTHVVNQVVHLHTILGKNNSTPGTSGRLMKSSTTGTNESVETSDALASISLGTAGSTIGSTGGGEPHNNLPPYFVVMIWKRIS